MKSRKPKISRVQPEAVVKAALEILDAEGLEGVTLRRLANRLGVKASTLYWYFKDKQDILDDMAQAILSTDKLNSMTAPENINDWASWLTDLAHSIRDALVAHREGGRVVAGASFRANALANLSFLSTRVLADAGFTPLQASIATSTIFDYIWGFVIEEQSHTDMPDDEQRRMQLRSFVDKFNSNTVRVFMEALAERHKLTPAREFDLGLKATVTGLESMRNKPV